MDNNIFAFFGDLIGHNRFDSFRRTTSPPFLACTWELGTTHFVCISNHSEYCLIYAWKFYLKWKSSNTLRNVRWFTKNEDCICFQGSWCVFFTDLTPQIVRSAAKILSLNVEVREGINLLLFSVDFSYALFWWVPWMHPHQSLVANHSEASIVKGAPFLWER